MADEDKGKSNGLEDAREDLQEGATYKERETWGSRFDFLLACIGFSVGLGNVWRFPYLCYKNGGGAFLIPYLICVVVGGIPLFFLEVAVGQFMGVAGINAWNICPFFRGIGLSTLIIVFCLNCYYNVILAWAFRYFFASFQGTLPWSDCDYDDWATAHCTKFEDQAKDNRCNYNDTVTNTILTGATINGTCYSPTDANAMNVTVYFSEAFNATQESYYVEPVTEYWENKVLAISDGIDEIGTPKWDIVLCLLFAWIVVYLCICQGIRSSGKVMYVTATSPYIFMLVLLIRNSLLDGAGDGITFYLKPDFEKMKEAQVWVDAGTQIFFSYSISLGALTALGSYNKFHHNSYRDAVLFALTNSGTSIFAGFIIFSILGHMAHIQEKDIADVAEAGPGLAFIAYPKALTLLPAAPFWSVMFFLMIILLGLDSQFVGVEGVVTAIVDQFPGFLRKGRRREVFIGFVCCLQFLVGLPMTCPGGMYVFQLFDYYSGSRIILFVAAFMCIAVAWCYGIRRFYDNISMMYGWRINPYMGIGWCFTAPVFCMVIFVLSAISYAELDYTRPKGTYSYPSWAVTVGWTMAGFAAIWIPLGWLYHIIRYGRNWEVIFVLSAISYAELDYTRPKGTYEYPTWAVAVGWTMAAFAAVWIPIGWIYHVIKYLFYGDWETFKLCFVPIGLQDHQLRPQDRGEKTLRGFNGEATIGTTLEPAKPYTLQQEQYNPPPYVEKGKDNPTFVGPGEGTFTRL